VLPYAHLGHYLWTLYLLPVLIIIAGIVYSQLAARRRHPSDPVPPSEVPEGKNAPPPGGAG